MFVPLLFPSPPAPGGATYIKFDGIVFSVDGEAKVSPGTVALSGIQRKVRVTSERVAAAFVLELTGDVGVTLPPAARFPAPRR